MTGIRVSIKVLIPKFELQQIIYVSITTNNWGCFVSTIFRLDLKIWIKLDYVTKSKQIIQNQIIQVSWFLLPKNKNDFSNPSKQNLHAQNPKTKSFWKITCPKNMLQ
jgi:hypothetical protein